MLLDKGWFFFFSSLSPASVSFCLDSHSGTGWLDPIKGVRKAKRNKPEVTVVEAEKQKEKRQPAL